MPFLICSCQGTDCLRIDRQIKWNIDRDQYCSRVSQSNAPDQYMSKADVGFCFFFSPRRWQIMHPHMTTSHWSENSSLPSRNWCLWHHKTFKTTRTIFLHMHMMWASSFVSHSNCSPQQSWTKQSSCKMSVGMCDPLSGRVCYLGFEDLWRSFRVMHSSYSHVLVLAGGCVGAVLH